MDDSFSLVADGNIIELVLTNPNDTGDQVYRTKGIFYPWSISYNPLTETWALVTGDGLTKVFGGGVTKTRGQPAFYATAECTADTNKCDFPKSKGNSVEWLVNWGNWIGPSANVSEQDNLAVAWNLSEVKNLWGESTVFAYHQITQYVSGLGTDRKKYSQESYLQQVTNVDNESLLLNYAKKGSNEYQDPHTHSQGTDDSLSFVLSMDASGWRDKVGEADPVVQVQIGTTLEPSKYYDHTFPEISNHNIITVNANKIVNESLSGVQIKIKILDADVGSTDTMFDYTSSNVDISEHRTINISETQRHKDYWMLSKVPIKVDFSITHDHLVSEPDAYQERYETQYLESIQYINNTGTVMSEVDLSYSMLGSLSKFKKRVLQSITHKIRESVDSATMRVTEPSQKFSYYGQAPEQDGVSGVTPKALQQQQYDYNIFYQGSLYGALKSVSNPEGGRVVYNYAKNTIANTSRQSPEIAYPTQYSDVKYYNGPGFHIMTWSGYNDNVDKMYLQIWMWDGQWKNQIFVLDNVSSALAYPEVKIASGSNFFTLVTPHKAAGDGTKSVHVFVFDPLRKNWVKNDINLQLTGGYELAAGTDFFAIIDETNGQLYRYQSQFNSVLQENSFSSVSAGPVNLPHSIDAKYALTVGPNFIFSYVDSTNHTIGAQARIDYQDVSGTWLSAVKPMGHLAEQYTNLPNFPSFGLQNVRALTGDNFVVIQGFSRDRTFPPPILRLAYPYTILTLPTELSNFSTDTSLERNLGGSYKTAMLYEEAGVYVTNDAVYFSATQSSTSTKTKAHYFNGHQWLYYETQNNFRNALYADLLMPVSLKLGGVLGATKQETSFQAYDPNSQTVGSSFASSTQVLQTAWQKYIHYALETASFITFAIPFLEEVGLVFDAVDLELNMADMQYEDYLKKNMHVTDLSSSAVGKSYLVSAGNVFYRNTDETWSSIGTVSGVKTTKPAIADTFFSFEGASNLDCNDAHNYTGRPGNVLFIQLLKNGQFNGDKLQLPKGRCFGVTENTIGQVQDTLITRGPKIVLYKALNDALTGNLDSYVVDSTKVEDGYNSGGSELFYAYDTTTATINAAGTMASYQKVTTTPDLASTADGKTEYYFLNGAINKNSPHIKDGTVILRANAVKPCQSGQPCPHPVPLDVTDYNLSAVQNLPYFKAIYDSKGHQVASESYFYEAIKNGVVGTHQAEYSWAVRKIKTETLLDGALSRVDTSYDDLGRVSANYHTNYSAGGNTEVAQTAYTYASSQYDMPLYDIPVQIISTLYSGTNITPKSLGNHKTQTANEVTTWKNWGTAPSPKWAIEKSYVALNNSPGDFNFSSGAPATAANWLETSDITNRDASTGAITEVKNADGVHSSVIYDSEYRFPVAHFTHASVSGTAAGYYGFEGYEIAGTWNVVGTTTASDSHTGAKALAGSGIAINPVVSPGTTFPRQTVVSAWVMTAIGETCHVGFQDTNGGWISGQSTSISNASEWHYLEASGSSSSTGPLPKAMCTEGAIDDFRFGPTDAPFTATVYNPLFHLPVAVLDTNGAVVRTLYDSLHRPSEITGPEPGNQTNFSYYFSRDGANNQDTFTPTDPNWTQISNGGSSPRQSRLYTDGLGRRVQTQQLSGLGKVITTAMIYDNWGNPAVTTKPAEKTAVFGFISGFANLDWTSMIMTGEVSTYYQTGLGRFSARGNDYQYPYSRIIHEASPLNRVIKVAASGETFSDKKGPVFTNPVFGTPLPDYTTHYDKGVDNPALAAAEPGLFALSGITFNQTNKGQFTGQKTSHVLSATTVTGRVPQTDLQRVSQVSLRSFNGSMLASYAGNSSLSARNSFTYQHNVSDGNLTATRYFPKSNLSNNSRNTHYTSVETIDYHGHTTQSSSTDRGMTKRLFDRLGRLRFLMDAEGDSQATDQVKYWKYDLLGRITEKGYISKNWSTITATFVENQSLPTTPTTWRTKYRYDSSASGNITNRKGRLTQIKINSDSENDVETTQTFSYNKTGQVVQDNLTVQDFSATPQSYETSYLYNSFGELTQIHYPSFEANEKKLTSSDSLLQGSHNYIGTEIKIGKGYRVASGASAQYGITSAANVQQPAVVYSYDSLGRMTGIGTPSYAFHYAYYAYKADGSLSTEVTNISKTPYRRLYNYNFVGQLINIEEDPSPTPFFEERINYKTTNDGENWLYQNGYAQHVQYEYSQSIGISEKLYSSSYFYDSLGRLKTVYKSTANLPESSYDYDLNGNLTRLDKGAVSKNYTYYPNTNRLKNTDGAGADYTYNADGAIITTPDITSISYDPFTKLPDSITKGGSTISFQYYDGDRRVLKDSPSGKRLYLHGIMPSPLVEIQGAETMHYIYGPTGIVAMHDGQKEYYLSKDHLGSTRIVRDQDNHVQAYFSYLPFGGVMEKQDVGDKFRYRYTGQEFDPELGIYNYNARLYDADLGRFYETDPGHQYTTPYAYVGNNPIKYTDPTGDLKSFKHKRIKAPFKSNATLAEKLEHDAKLIHEKLGIDSMTTVGASKVGGDYIIGKNARGTMTDTELGKLKNLKLHYEYKAFELDEIENPVVTRTLSPGDTPVKVNVTGIGQIEMSYPKSISRVKVQGRNYSVSDGVSENITGSSWGKDVIIGRIKRENMFATVGGKVVKKIRLSFNTYPHFETNVARYAKAKNLTFYATGTDKAACFHCEKQMTSTGVSFGPVTNKSAPRWTRPFN